MEPADRATGRLFYAARFVSSMGFGSYDESEQRDPDYGGDDEEGEDATVDLHENDHEGAVSFDSGASTDDLVDRLADIKEAAAEEAAEE